MKRPIAWTLVILMVVAALAKEAANYHERLPVDRRGLHGRAGYLRHVLAGKDKKGVTVWFPNRTKEVR